MKTKTMVVALVCLLTAGYSESKGQDNMKNRIIEHQVEVFNIPDEGVRVTIPMKWQEDLHNVEVWFELGGQSPIIPPVMPYKPGGKDRIVKANSRPGFGPVFDSTKLVPGKKYKLMVKIEGTVNGRTYVDTEEMSILIPKPIDMNETAQGSAAGTPADALRSFYERQLRVQLRVKRNGGEYNYELKNNDKVGISHITLEIRSPIQVTGTPNGWKGMHTDGQGMGWGTTFDNALAPGKTLNGFQVTGSPNRDNIVFAIVGGEKVKTGQTIGPGN